MIGLKMNPHLDNSILFQRYNRLTCSKTNNDILNSHTNKSMLLSKA